MIELGHFERSVPVGVVKPHLMAVGGGGWMILYDYAFQTFESFAIAANIARALTLVMPEMAKGLSNPMTAH